MILTNFLNRVRQNRQELIRGSILAPYEHPSHSPAQQTKYQELLSDYNTRLAQLNAKFPEIR
jgi:hypothetical protein